MDSPAPEQPQRPDFTQGFGSFDFFPHEYEFESLPRAISTDSLQKRDYSTLDVPIDPFPLMSLPAEIRWKIYQFWLAKLYSSRISGIPPNANNSGICFRLSDSGFDPDTQVDHHGPILCAVGDPDARGTPALHPPKDEDTQREPAGQSHNLGTREGPADFEESTEDSGSDYSSDTDSEQSQSAASNGREPRIYELSIERSMDLNPECKYCGPPSSDSDSVSEDPYWNLDDCSCDYRSPNDYEDVRILAQVSPALTKELGECTWLGSTLDVLNAELLVPFLLDRPAVVPLIRGVVLRVEFYGYPYDTLAETIKEICDFVLEKMQLTFFTLSVYTDTFATDREWKPVTTPRAKDGGSADVDPSKEVTVVLRQLRREWEEPLRDFLSRFTGLFGVEMSKQGV